MMRSRRPACQRRRTRCCSRSRLPRYGVEPIRTRRFAARFYRAIALCVNQRLRRAVRDMGQLWTDAGQVQRESDATWDAIAAGIDGFKALMAEADKDALKNAGVVSAAFAAEITTACHSLAGGVECAGRVTAVV